MAQVSTFAVALGGSEQDIQKAAHPVRQCYWAVRCLSVLLRDKLHQEGLWPDLMQEIEIAAWEAGREGLSDRDARRLAARRLYAFIRSCGYIPYRKGYYKPESTFASAFGSMTGELQDIVVSRARPMPGFVAWWREHKDTVLTVIRESPSGISKRDLCCSLRISRRELDWQCEPLVQQGLVKVVKRSNLVGRPRTPLLVEASVRIPEEDVIQVDRDEEIRRLHLAGMGVKRIARQLHHSRKTVTTVIRAMQQSRAA